MNALQDTTFSELEAVTAEMAELPDLASQRLGDLLERRGILIKRLIAGKFDAGDARLASIVCNADRLQERLQGRSDSLRADLTGLKTIGALMAAVKSTFGATPPQGLDVSA